MCCMRTCTFSQGKIIKHTKEQCLCVCFRIPSRRDAPKWSFHEESIIVLLFQKRSPEKRLPQQPSQVCVVCVRVLAYFDYVQQLFLLLFVNPKKRFRKKVFLPTFSLSSRFLPNSFVKITKNLPL